MKKFIITEDDKSHIRGMYEQNQPSPQPTQTLVNKVATEGIKNVTPKMISSPQFKGTYTGYVFGGTFDGVKYEWNCNGVEGIIGTYGLVNGEIFSESVENMFSEIKEPMTDGKPGTPSVGFMGGDIRFIIYTTTGGKVKCLNF